MSRKVWECLECVDILERPGPTQSKQGLCGKEWNNVEERGKLEVSERPGPIRRRQAQYWKVRNSLGMFGICRNPRKAMTNLEQAGPMWKNVENVEHVGNMEMLGNLG